MNEATEEYSERFGRETNYVLKEIKPEERSSGVSAEQGMVAEEKRILEAIPQGAYLVVLDERGGAPTSLELTNYLRVWTQSGNCVCFIIGGTDGMTEELKQQAKLILCLSSLTLSYSMVRVLLAEQLYRTASILNNHPYHRGWAVFVRIISSSGKYRFRQIS